METLATITYTALDNPNWAALAIMAIVTLTCGMRIRLPRLPERKVIERTAAPETIVMGIGCQRIAGREVLKGAVMKDDRKRWRRADSGRYTKVPEFEAIGVIGMTRIGF